MNNQSDNLAHRRLAASCFNKTWEYLRKLELSAEEAEEMIHSRRKGGSHVLACFEPSLLSLKLRSPCQTLVLLVIL